MHPDDHPADEPLPDLFADVDATDGDSELPDLAPGDRGRLPDLAAGEQGTLEDLGGDWEAPTPSPVADAGDDDWAPVVPAPAASRGDRRAARAARRARRGAEADGREVLCADDGRERGRSRSGAPPAPALGHPADGDPSVGQEDAGDAPAAIPADPAAPATGVPQLEPSSLFSSEDPADGTPKRPLTAEERLQHAITLAYRHLSKRDRTVAEVRAHLEKRAVDAASVQGAIAELVEVGYLDDARYAERFVEDKRRLEGWGHLRIEQGLRKTGIDTALVESALADDPLRDDEDELAVEALEQRLRGQAPDGDRGRQKALRLLATKGYALETAYAAVRAYERRCAERAEQ